MFAGSGKEELQRKEKRSARLLKVYLVEKKMKLPNNLIVMSFATFTLVGYLQLHVVDSVHKRCR